MEEDKRGNIYSQKDIINPNYLNYFRSWNRHFEIYLIDFIHSSSPSIYLESVEIQIDLG